MRSDGMLAVHVERLRRCEGDEGGDADSVSAYKFMNNILRGNDSRFLMWWYIQRDVRLKAAYDANKFNIQQLVEYFWDYDNNGLKLMQVRFYETTSGSIGIKP